MFVFFSLSRPQVELLNRFFELDCSYIMQFCLNRTDLWELRFYQSSFGHQKSSKPLICLFSRFLISSETNCLKKLLHCEEVADKVQVRTSVYSVESGLIDFDDNKPVFKCLSRTPMT